MTLSLTNARRRDRPCQIQNPVQGPLVSGCIEQGVSVNALVHPSSKPHGQQQGGAATEAIVPIKDVPTTQSPRSKRPHIGIFTLTSSRGWLPLPGRFWQNGRSYLLFRTDRTSLSLSQLPISPLLSYRDPGRRGCRCSSGRGRVL
jgi:hypothetical protein